MKSSTLLDSIAFQLTPTRTRCDLVITANGKTEKIASGLLDPFLAHLKAAQDQIGKGGYSIVLKPNHGSDTSWFTKGTVERFVRFVSTPEILERAYTIESEILQIEKAISLQSSNDPGLHNAVDNPLKREDSLEGSKPAQGGNEEKAIVLYQPANHQAEDGSPLEKNSKVQLVQVLETRKSVLQKEQGMAFARAIAASLDIDSIAALISFAECFGASRMLDACKKFVHLWKAKHESGQWVEVEANEAMSYPADMPSSNSSGIVFHSSHEYSQGEATPEKNGKADRYDRSQPHPMFAPWQMNSQGNGMPVFPPYPMQGMPYYQNYPGNNMFFQSPYPPHNEPRVHPDQRTRRRRHSVDSVDMSCESETEETDTSRRRTQDDGNRGGKSSKKRAGKVVIRNINYIARAKEGSGDSDVESCSGDDSNDDSGHNKGNDTRKNGKPVKSSSGDDGNWQAFQNFLLTDADESRNSVNSMFAMEGKLQGRKRQNAIGDSSSALGRRSMGEGIGSSDRFEISGDTTCIRKQVDDQMLSYRREANLVNSPFDPVISNGLQGSADNNRNSSQALADESFVGLHRRDSVDQVAGDGRAAMNMNYELPAENHTVGNDQSNYEANDLNLMPNRAMEVGLSDYDPAVDYQMQAQVKKAIQQSGNSKKVTSGIKQGPKKTVKDQKLKAERLLASTRREKPSKSSSLEDARARAEKLRAYKADLQKLKKEKEEEQLKRLEALKLERQKRIAARSGTTVPQSPSASQQARKSLPKLSPISHKGSKFSDTEPGSSSPLQRSTIKLVRKVSSDSTKVSKPVKSIGGSQSNGNRLTRSASSLSVRHEENNGPTPESKATIARIRRLSEPKNIVHHVSSGKTQSAEGVSRRRVAERAETRKRPADVDSDNAKSSSLPEQKLNTSKGSLVSVQKRLTYKEKLQKPSEKSLSHPARDGDDSVVEKTVVMLEFKKPENSVFHQHDNETSIHNMQRGVDENVGGILEEDTSIPPPASPIIVKEIECKPSSREVKRHSYTRSVDVSSSLPNVGTAEEPYRAPYARISSTEDRCMVESEYGKALPTSFSMASTGVQTTRALVSDGQKEDSIKISQAVLGKHQGKDSAKGFRKLLKFGKWSSAGSDSSIDLDKTSLEGAGASDNALNGSSSEVFTLKNLLTQEESSSTVTASKKSSRSFSLLSPFKSKSSEKKATA
ncbi:uncharacterized protein LOC141606845 [Silene latifolia]|uniref:uncharacterized protein LOC141606845 n=1 Tax=Silene latifolia TaxID=37657 RepID=UPI003D77D09D